MAHVLVKDLREAAIKFILEGKLTESSQISNLKRVSEDGYFNNYLIPETWEIVSLNECCYIHARIGWQALTKSEHQKQGDYLLITGTDFKNGFVDYSNCVYVSKERYDMDSKIQLQNDDILITKDGTLGKVAVVKDLPKPATLNSGVFVIRPDERFEKKYIEYLFQGSYFSKFIDSVKYGTTIKHLNQNKLVNFLIPVPSKGEQKSIVAKIDELMAKIDEYEKLENELVELKKNFPGDMKAAVLQAAMQGKLTEQLKSDSNITLQKCNYPDEDAIPFDIPESWMWCSLKNVANNIGGFAFKSTNFTKKGTRVIRISDFNELGLVNNKIVRYEYNDKLSNYLIQNQDILMCMTGGTVGKNYYVQDLKEDCLLNQRVACIRAKNVNSEYLNLVIKSPFVQQLIVNNKNSTNDNISMDLINNFPIPLPPIEEQQRIVEKLDKLLPLCDALCEGLYGR